MQWRITVQKGKGFSPQQQQAQSGDAVFWFNEDENETHQPVSTDPNAKWTIAPITGRNSSELLNLNTASTVQYTCKNHPEETGTITVASGIPIAYGADPLFGAPLSIGAGQSVSWANSDAQAHQPTPNTGDPWFTAPIASGDISACIPFPNAGTYDYYCELHPNETGTITVT